MAKKRDKPKSATKAAPARPAQTAAKRPAASAKPSPRTAEKAAGAVTGAGATRVASSPIGGIALPSRPLRPERQFLRRQSCRACGRAAERFGCASHRAPQSDGRARNSAAAPQDGHRRRASDHPLPTAGDHRGDLLRDQPKGTTTGPPPPEARPTSRALGVAVKSSPARQCARESRVNRGWRSAFPTDSTSIHTPGCPGSGRDARARRSRPMRSRRLPRGHRFVSPTSSVLSSRPCTATQRATLTSFAARSLRIAAVQGDTATFELRQAMGGPGLRETGTLQIGPNPDIGVIGPSRTAACRAGRAADRHRAAVAADPEPAQRRTLASRQGAGHIARRPHRALALAARGARLRRAS